MGYDHYRFARRIGSDLEVRGLGSGNDTYYRANDTDANDYIKVEGLGNIRMYSTYGLNLYQGVTGYTSFTKSGSDTKITSSIANNDLFLELSGTGVLKFGTHTATGDAVSNGSIAIKDAGGTVRKLMTKA